jgi:hypothetical protein
MNQPFGIAAISDDPPPGQSQTSITKCSPKKKDDKMKAHPIDHPKSCTADQLFEEFLHLFSQNEDNVRGGISRLTEKARDPAKDVDRVKRVKEFSEIVLKKYMPSNVNSSFTVCKLYSFILRKG